MGRLLHVILRNERLLWQVAIDPAEPCPQRQLGTNGQVRMPVGTAEDRHKLDNLLVKVEERLADGHGKLIDRQGLTRFVMFHTDQAIYQQRRAEEGRTFKVNAGKATSFLKRAELEIHRPESGERPPEGDGQWAVTMALLDALPLHHDEREYVLGMSLQVPSQRRKVRVERVAGTDEQLRSIYRLGVRHLGSLQSSVAAMAERIRTGTEAATIACDPLTGIITGYVRWWGLTPKGAARIRSGEVRTGGQLDHSTDLCRLMQIGDGDHGPLYRPESTPGSALYLSMIVGETGRARRAVMEHAVEVVSRPGSIEVFTKPTTVHGHRAVTNPRFGFEQLTDADAIWRRDPAQALVPPRRKPR
ncbi:hypothetical protein [Egicoccus sp. AB-alg2]|uniref:hypothetical protein n=1 Tax=Egicoccus sp. AB-alg2 TaxID=3242693 RepID=UPI00359EA391